MEDLMKDLARVKPPTPEVDPERMERDLARITALPRPRSVRLRSLRRFTPLLVAAAVIALVVVLLPKPTQPVQPAAPASWWHVLTEQTSLMIVGDPANPYTVRFHSKTDQWLTADTQVTVVQKDGEVMPYSNDDTAKWEAAGKPATAPQVGGSRSVRIGPMKPAVQKTNVAGFQMSLHSNARFDSFESLPADPVELKNALETISGKDTYKTASLAMGLMSANVRDEQRRAAFELLKNLDGAHSLPDVDRPEGRIVGVAIPAPPTFQFSDVETQLWLKAETGLPHSKSDVITTPQHGLPRGTPIATEVYLLLDKAGIDPIVPQNVTVNGEVESPIIER
ncbi:hypothetical protein [Lentzea flava]|uniref:CU044_5270 family protein n=1 Tax=Lentzea flava TaxID=103732 RepID=A0ABQ2UC84_9PSEU|nr:hypothetical protein [Lentzea flava]MCP2197543.1 hypothetical protein [Lentzea flava]GGU20398.1 hypothetical protein GCM10010178_10690 [Lentzea flava]